LLIIYYQYYIYYIYIEKISYTIKEKIEKNGHTYTTIGLKNDKNNNNYVSAMCAEYLELGTGTDLTLMVN